MRYRNSQIGAQQGIVCFPASRENKRKHCGFDLKKEEQRSVKSVRALHGRDDTTLATTRRRLCSSGCRRYAICLASPGKPGARKAMGTKACEIIRPPRRGEGERFPCAMFARPPGIFASAL